MNSLILSRLSLATKGTFSTYSTLFKDNIFLLDFSSYACLYAASSLLKSPKLLLRVIYHSSVIAILTLAVCLISPLIVLDAIPEIPGKHELTNAWGRGENALKLRARFSTHRSERSGLIFF